MNDAEFLKDTRSIVGQITQECFVMYAKDGNVIMRPEFEDRLVLVIEALKKENERLKEEIRIMTFNVGMKGG